MQNGAAGYIYTRTSARQERNTLPGNTVPGAAAETWVGRFLLWSGRGTEDGLTRVGPEVGFQMGRLGVDLLAACRDRNQGGQISRPSSVNLVTWSEMCVLWAGNECSAEWMATASGDWKKKKKALVLNTLKRASSSIRGALKSKQIRCVGISLLCCT